MKQTLFMVAATLLGVGGAFTMHPFWGIALYYFYAVLRPQFIWEWSLPTGTAWSFYAALAAIVSTVCWKLGLLSFHAPGAPARRPAFNAGHYGLALFAGWVTVTYFTAHNRDVAYPFYIEYLKIFVMFLVAALAIQSVRQLWVLYLILTGTLCYIAYEMNAIYLFQGSYTFIYRRGYGGLDNNGAGLMLAMGVPLCVFAWDGIRHPTRWLFLLCVPPIMHAVLTSYSRGAMLALILTVPHFLLRCRHRVQLLLMLIGVGLIIPTLAGQEIRQRFFSIEKYQQDDSANSRFSSWAIAWRMAQERPVFGLGVRNSNLFTFAYGADMVGRTIHSQYLQIAADSGLVGLAAYLAALGGFALCARRARLAVRGRDDLEARRVHTIACGAESSLLLFCIGGVFLSLETFELPYILLLMGAQLWALCQASLAEPHRLPDAAGPDTEAEPPPDGPAGEPIPAHHGPQP
jgi:probable O-glycosylation ligase (exosortase A-associated)